MKKIIRITTVPISLKILLKGQLKYISNYYDIIAVSSDGDCFDSMLEEQGIHGKRIEISRKITPFKDLISLFRLIIFFKKEKPFIVHTHTPKAGTLGMIASWAVGVPHRFHTVAGLPLLEAKGPKRLLLNIVEKITYSCATKVYPNSFGLRDIITENKLASTKKLNVICNGSSNGIDTSYFSIDSLNINLDTLKTELGIGDKTFTFCFIGRLVKDKGINELVRAFIKLCSICDNIRLILVGSFEKDLDPISAEIENLIHTHKSITFTNFQSDVRPYLAISNALVFPSYREGFPNVVMQAGAMGLPSIVTDINGCNEIIIEGKNGIIIPPKDEAALYNAMKYFIEQKKDKVKEMAANARPMIESRYEQKMIWNAILEMYNSLDDKNV